MFKIQAAKRMVIASWPSDFFTKLAKDLPSEFKEGKSQSMRGTYSDLVDFNVYKLASKDAGFETFSFELDAKSKKEPSPAGLSNFLSDVRKIAKKEGYAEAKTPDDLKSIKGKAFLLGRTSKGIKLLVKGMS